MRSAHGWKVYLAGGLAAIGAYFLLPSGGLGQAVVYMGLQLAVLVALVAGVAVNRPSHPLVWRVLLGGQLVYLVANVLWYPYPLLVDAELTYPGPHDPMFILSYVVQAGALALLVRIRSGSRNRADLIDASIIGLGVGVLLWISQIDPAIDGTGLSPLAAAFTIAYPVFDLVLFGLVMRLVVGGERNPALWLIALAVTGQLSADIGYAETALFETFTYGSFVFAGWLLMFTFLGAAALHPSMRDLARPTKARRHTTLRRRLPFLAAAALVGPAVLVVHDLVGADLNVPLIGVLTSLIFLLILARVADLMVDVAEHERVQEQLSELALIVGSTDDAVIGFAADGTITSWNAAAVGLSGYRHDEIVGRPYAILFPPHAREQATEMVSSVMSGRQVGHRDHEMQRKDETLVDISITVSAVRNAAGDIVGGAAIARDITGKKRIEADLALARDQALEGSRMKSEFLATMSHEIRTPMNGVIGLTGLLLTTPLDDRQRNYAEGVHSAGEALLAVINDILDFSKIEAGKIELEVVDIDLRKLVEEMAGMVAEAADRKGLELMAWCEPDVPAIVRGDGGRLRQVLLNLAGNAVKFTDRGEVAVSGRLVRQGANGVVVRFEVVDTGIGITPIDRERLFQPFSQADASTTRRYGGTGLGLAISAQLVAAMGGELRVESEPGRGSTFSFELTFGRGSANGRVTQPSHGVLDGVKVLVVDDNASNRLILEEQLRSWGMRPESTADGLTALRRLREACGENSPFGLALLDMCMPQLDGLELARRVSAEPAMGATRLVLLTSSAGVEPEAARRVGIRALLTKPVRQSQLYDALMSVVGPVRPIGAAPISDAPKGGTRRGQVLVVEDNPTNQMVATGILTHLGWSAHVVGDGVEALAAVERDAYDAVLMDCQMPRMDGYTATAEIRRREGGGRRLPVIAMTASAVEGDRERCLAAGMDDYVSKPVRPQDVSAALDRWVGSRRSAPRPAGEPAAASDGSPQPGSAVDGGRLETLRTLGAADGTLLDRLVDAFLADAPASLAVLREAVARGESAAVRQAAHRLRGAAANLGATSMAALCAALEEAGGSGDLSAASDVLRRTEAELEPVRRALRAAMSGAPT